MVFHKNRYKKQYLVTKFIKSKILYNVCILIMQTYVHINPVAYKLLSIKNLHTRNINCRLTTKLQSIIK